jgi:GT2 family glycosyltransferase
MGPSLAVCVINHQGRDVLASTLAAVRAQRPPPAEIVLVDNASTDGGPDLVRASFPEVRVVRLPENRGPGPARDAGYRAVAADLVGFVDNDVMPSPDCFALLAEGLAQAPGATLAMPRVLHADAPERIQFEGAQAHFLGLMTLEAAERPVAGTPAVRREIGSIVTACFLVDRRRWGGRRLQDPSFFIYHEDHDLGLRARQLGHRIVAVPGATCLHGRGTPGVSIRAVEGYSSTRVAFTIANRWRIILTRYELRTILLLAPALLAFELCQLAGAVAKGWLASWARAFAIVARDLPRIARERREWAAQRRCGDGRVLAGGALPFNPRLLTGRLERGVGAAISAALALNWLLARPLLNHGPTGRRRR